ncbi:MAG: hypothetical protein A4E53_03536 [Pelotomaculum sp. PtaB.Bin104]|nr:MAG: hypothetical protein A4E53_03536 [Pelotomaculum sp. PtaB.Bin104]
MKITHFIIALYLITLIAGCAVEKKESSNNQVKEAVISMDQANFNLIFKYGVGAKNILNTFEGTYTKDMIPDIGLLYIFPPAELMAVLPQIPRVSFSWGFPETILYGLYALSRPLLWAPLLRILLGIAVAGGLWVLVFYSFMAATVRQSRKGLRVQIVTGAKRGRRLLFNR